MLLKNSKIYQILTCLSRKERNKLINIIANKQYEHHHKLAEIIFKSIDDNTTLPDKETLFNIIFPNKHYEDVRFRLLMSELLEQAENIIALSQLEEDYFTKDLYLLKAFHQRGLKKFAENALSELTQKMDKHPHDSALVSYQKFLIELEKYEHRQKKNREAYDFKPLTEYLDAFIVAERFRVSALIINQKQILGKENDLGSTDTLMQYAENNPNFLKTPIVQLQYYSIQLQLHQENDYYFNILLDFIFNNTSNIEGKLLNDALLMANNYCIKKMNAGHKEYYQKSFDLYIKGIETGVLVDNGNITKYSFKNIFTLCIRLKKFEFAQEFIKKYYTHVEKKYQEGIYAYYMGTLFYEMQDYERAIPLLHNESPKEDPLMHLAAKNLLLKCYYFEQNFEAMELLMGATVNYIKRKGIGEQHKENYLNIIKFVRKLLVIEQIPNTKTFRESKIKKTEKLKKQILEQQTLTEKNWLLSSCDKIIQNS